MIFLPQESPKPYAYRVLKSFLENEPQGLGIVLGAESRRMACRASMSLNHAPDLTLVTCI